MVPLQMGRQRLLHILAFRMTMQQQYRVYHRGVDVSSAVLGFELDRGRKMVDAISQQIGSGKLVLRNEDGEGVTVDSFRVQIGEVILFRSAGA